MLFTCKSLHLLLACNVFAIWNVSDSQHIIPPDSIIRPAVICDAGSTGSRVFSFFIHDKSREVVVELLGRTDIGLSQFAQAGRHDMAVSSLAPIILKGIKRLGPFTPVYIFATGGVRQLSQKDIEYLWSRLTIGIKHTLGNAHDGKLTIRTVHGSEEALFGLISANYLLGNVPLVDIRQTLANPVGVLDLGGSSLEVSIAGFDSILGTHDDILVSFNNLGMSQGRLAVGATDPTGQCQFGTGNGKACRQLIRDYVSADADFSTKIKNIPVKSVSKFVGISGFVYVMDFARWILAMKLPGAYTEFVAQFPSPSISAMREACDLICAMPMLESLFSQHPYSSTSEVKGRCFDICYVSEVLSIIFDGINADRLVHFLLEANGVEIEWTLGYYINYHGNTEDDEIVTHEEL